VCLEFILVHKNLFENLVQEALTRDAFRVCSIIVFSGSSV